MDPRLAATLRRIPARPGVYLLRDARGEVLYVGKAQDLRSRVRSYWQRQSGGEVHRIRSAIHRVADAEWTLTDSVSEALLLEATLIKRYRPRYNVRLKDDKSYPYIRITLGDDYPRIERTRKLRDDGSRYFGPYASAKSVDESMDLIRRLFRFRTCTIEIHEGERALARPCLLYHIKRCQGPCVEAIGKAEYRADIAQVGLFLEGRHDAVARTVRSAMGAASDAQEYERAASLRDKLRAIERTMESQKMAAYSRAEADVLGLARRDAHAAVQVFAVRAGTLIGRDVFLLDAPRDVPDAEVLGGFIQQYYLRAASVPAVVLAPLEPPDVAGVEEFLADRRGGRRTTVRVPRRGEKRDLVDLATRNAAETLDREAARWLADEGKTLEALEELAVALGLPGPPTRIECYDISTIQGTDTVGSMVVFEDGQPARGEYRRFRIRTVAGQDDFASHAEVMRRRFRRPAAEEEGAVEELRWRMPDLVVVDGGRGQLAAAVEAARSAGVDDTPFVGLAKEREELFVPGAADPVVLPATSPALYLVQRLRDEAHRFAITYHRDLRAKRSVRSALDEIPGVGPARKRALLREFGSVRRIREASPDEVAAVPGIGSSLAERILASLAD